MPRVTPAPMPLVGGTVSAQTGKNGLQAMLRIKDWASTLLGYRPDTGIEPPPFGVEFSCATWWELFKEPEQRGMVAVSGGPETLEQLLAEYPEIAAKLVAHAAEAGRGGRD